MKRYQAVSIKYLGTSDTHFRVYKIILHDRIGQEGYFGVLYFGQSKREIIKHCRRCDVEVSKYVENGGSLRLC